MPHRARRILIAGVILLVLAVAYSARIRGGMADFAVYYRAGQRLEAGEPLYRSSDGHYMFKYLPASALLFVPFGHMSFDTAKATWFAVSLVALACCFVLAWQVVPAPHRRYLLVLSGLVLAKYFLHELRLGQINIVVMALMLLATRVLSRPADARRDAASGALAGIAAALKPYAVVFLPYFVLTRNWKATAATVATLVVALCLPVLFYGIHGNIQALADWAASLSQSTPAQLANNDNVSVLAFFTKWLGPGTATLVASAAVLAAFGVLMLAVIVRGSGERARAVLECAMLLTLIPLVSPMGWDYTFLLALLAVALLINAFGAFPRAAQAVLAVNFAVIALAVFDLMGRRAYAAFMQWSFTTVNFAIVVVALVYLRFRTDL